MCTYIYSYIPISDEFLSFFFSRKSSSYLYSWVAENLFKLPCKHVKNFPTQFHCFVAQTEIYRRQRMFRLINILNI